MASSMGSFGFRAVGFDMVDSASDDETGDDSRSAALLTASQRQFLRGEHNYERGNPSVRAIRGGIRKRVRESLLDMRILAEYLEDRDVQQIFDFEGLPSEERQALNDGLECAIALFYGGTRNRVPGFEYYLEGGVTIGERWLAGTGRLVVDVEFDVQTQRLEDLSPEVAAAKIAQGDFDKLDEEEMRQFLELAAVGALPYPQGDDFTEQEMDGFDKFRDRLEDIFRLATEEGELPLETIERMKDESDQTSPETDNEERGK